MSYALSSLYFKSIHSLSIAITKMGIMMMGNEYLIINLVVFK